MQQCARMTTTMPTVFLPHGGGPLPLLGAASQASLTAFLKSFRKTVSMPQQPKAILLVSAHWEASKITVSTCPKPGMLYDYYGFPPESYKLQYPAPGSPQVAARALELLKASGLPAGEDATRGYDHATFIPLMLAYPDADIPVVQMSLQSKMDPEHHVDVGRALAPLRDEGVLIIGSGLSFHNMQAFQQAGFNAPPGGKAWQPSEDFDAWLQAACTQATGAARDKALAAWASAPGARQCHPREEHLIPLMVAAGAAGDSDGKTVYSDVMMGARTSGFVFGA